MSDYEIQEIRRIRHQISAEHGHDLKRLAEYYRQLELELKNSGKYRFFGEEKKNGTNTRSDFSDDRSVPLPAEPPIPPFQPEEVKK